MRIRIQPRLAVVVAAALMIGAAAASFHPLSAQEKPASGKADRITVLTTREWSPDGRVPTGTIWRGFQTWQTDVARTGKGELVRVDPLTPRAERSEKGERIRYLSGWAGKSPKSELEVCPAREVHGSAYPPAGWQAPDFDDRNWIRDPYPQRELYGLVALRCLRGKFEVTDPAKVTGLSLTVRFRGGAAAYLNGKEIGRAFLPQGEIRPDTLAQDYPKEAFVDSEGVVIPQAMGIYKSGPEEEERKKTGAYNIEKGLAKWGGRWRSVSVENASPGFFLSGDPEVVTKYKSRTRKLEVKVPTRALRKGTNVLAIEIHRAPAWEGMFTSPSYYDGKKSLLSLNWAETWWDRAEVEDVKLTAAGAEDAIVPNIAPPKGLRVWNHPVDVEVDPSYYGDPNEPLRPIRLWGLKNGTYSGQIVASSTDPIKGLNVRVTELKGPGGRTIPMASIQVGYSRPSDGFYANNTKEIGEGTSDAHSQCEWPLYDTIEPAAPEAVTKVAWGYKRTFPPMQPVWLTVRVPGDARAGEYRGTVTVNVEGREPLTTSLEVEVVGDWVLPDAKDFTTYVGFLEGPDAVARRYKVALWSEEHWRLLDRVFEVLGQMGTKEVWIPLVAKTHLGNPYAMVRWVRQPDGTYRCDTAIAEKYLDLAVKHLGKVPVVCLYVAMSNQYYAGDQPICTELDPATGELKDLLPPKWGTPEARAFWKPVLDRMREVLAGRGMEKSMMFGYLGDGVGYVAPQNASGLPNYFSDLRTLAPETRWMVTTHANPISYHAGKLRNVEFIGVHSYMFPVLNSTLWMDGNDDVFCKPKYGWRDASFPFRMLVASRSRSPILGNDHCGNVSRLRLAPEGALLPRSGGYVYQGFGSWGADFWGNEWQTYDPKFGNVGLSESTSLWFVGPGEAGPVPTCRTRMLQEGLQEAEARIFVQNAVLDEDKRAKLGDDLARRCREACDERTRMFTYMANFRYNDGEGSMPRSRVIPDVAAWDEAAVKLYRLADEVQKALGGK